MSFFHYIIVLFSLLIYYGVPGNFNFWGEEEARPLHLLRSNLIMDRRFRRQSYCFLLPKLVSDTKKVRQNRTFLFLRLFSRHLMPVYIAFMHRSFMCGFPYTYNLLNAFASSANFSRNDCGASISNSLPYVRNCCMKSSVGAMYHSNTHGSTSF